MNISPRIKSKARRLWLRQCLKDKGFSLGTCAPASFWLWVRYGAIERFEMRFARTGAYIVEVETGRYMGVWPPSVTHKVRHCEGYA